jgi:hypothetical protein
LVDLAGVTHDDIVFEMTDHYFGQNYELAPWDTWVWREGNCLVSRGAAKRGVLDAANHKLEAELREVIGAWPLLSADLRKAVLTIIRAGRDG